MAVFFYRTVTTLFYVVFIDVLNGARQIDQPPKGPHPYTDRRRSTTGLDTRGTRADHGELGRVGRPFPLRSYSGTRQSRSTPRTHTKNHAPSTGVRDTTTGILGRILLHTPRHTAVRAPRELRDTSVHRAHTLHANGVNTERLFAPGALNRRWPTLVAPVLFVEVEAAAPSFPSTTLRTRRRRRAPIW